MKADCHIHMLLDGQDWKAAIARHHQQPDISFIRNALALYQAQGYTYLRDGGDRWGVGAKARELAPEYGIAYRTPLSPLCKAGHYGSFIGETYENLREYAQLVQKNRLLGGNFIKIMVSGLMDFNHAGVLTEEGLSREEIRELIHIAHEEGFSVMAHCNGPRTMEISAEAGVDSIEHGAYADETALSSMVQMGTIWVPTVSTIANLRGKDRFAEQAVTAILETATENIRHFVRLGGVLAPGSDAGAWAVPHGADCEASILAEILGDEAFPVLARGADLVKQKF